MGIGSRKKSHTPAHIDPDTIQWLRDVSHPLMGLLYGVEDDWVMCSNHDFHS